MNGNEPCGCGGNAPCPSHVTANGNGNNGVIHALDGTPLAGMTLDQLASWSLVALVALQFWTFFTRK